MFQPLKDIWIVDLSQVLAGPIPPTNCPDGRGTSKDRKTRRGGLDQQGWRHSAFV